MVRKHYPRQRVFSNWVMNHQIRHKVHKSDYYNSYLDLQNSSTGYNWPIEGAPTYEQENPLWLEWLRKLAEISSLLKEIMPTLASKSSINPFIRFVDNSNMSLPPFKIEDLKIIGYKAYICEKCPVFSSVNTLLT